MKLRELNAKFVRREVRKVDPTQFVDGVLSPSGEQIYHVPVTELAQADGIYFDCPKCKGTKDAHSVLCWFVGKVADDVRPLPGRWTPQGTGLDDLTFIPSRGRTESVQLLGGGCAWHGFVKDGSAA